MKKFLLVLLTCFFLTNALLAAPTAQAQDTYSLQIGSFVWDHFPLNLLIIPAENMSWWDPLSVNATLRAVGQWNEALGEFAGNYSQYSYLANLRLQPSVSTQWKSGYDVYINYIESPTSSDTDEVGLTQIYANSLNVIANCTVNLATHTSHGTALSEADTQNVALHELGHTLGLGHCNYTADLMYAYYGIGSGQVKVSTLDAYGVAVVCSWMLNPESFYPTSDWLKTSSVTLPPAITYQEIDVSAQNQPPQTLADNPIIQVLTAMYELLLHPEIAVIVIAVMAALVVAGLSVRYWPRSRAPKADS
jgi:predicted Zn-dependent protease